MADPRKADRTIVLKNERKKTVKIEMYCATAWPDAPGARAGLVRLRVNGRWLYGAQRFTFFNAEGVTTLVGAFLAGQGLELPPSPELPRGSRVRVPSGQVLDGVPVCNKTQTLTEPILGVDGRWYVAVTLFGRGAIHVAVDQLVDEQAAQRTREHIQRLVDEYDARQADCAGQGE